MTDRDHDFPMIVVRKNAAETIRIYLRKTMCGPYLDLQIWSQG